MKITAAKVIVTCPGRNFVTLKIETDQGVYGIGDGTLNGRELSVVAYLEEHVIPCLIGIASKLDGSGRLATLAGFVSKMGLASGPLLAVLTLSALPVITLYLMMSKQFIAGLTAGAVKG